MIGYHRVLETMQKMSKHVVLIDRILTVSYQLVHVVLCRLSDSHDSMHSYTVPSYAIQSLQQP